MGVVWEPWFNIPPVDYVNGGEVLRGHPVFAPLKRSPWEITTLGFDVRKMGIVRPEALVFGTFEMRDPMRIRDRGAERFMQAVQDEYVILQAFNRAPGGPEWTNRAIHDWLYPFPDVFVALRGDLVEGTAGAAPRGQ